MTVGWLGSIVGVEDGSNVGVSVGSNVGINVGSLDGASVPEEKILYIAW